MDGTTAELTPPAEAAPEVDVKLEASLDALIEGKDADEAIAIGERARDSKGKFTKKTVATPDASSPDADGVDEGGDALSAIGEAGDEVTKEVRGEEYEKALTALKRDGLPQSVIDSMDEATVMEYGNKRLKNQTDVDAYTDQLADLKKQIQATDDTETPDDPSQPAEREPRSKSDGDTVNQLVEQFSEIFGEDIGEPFGDALNQLQSENSTLRDRLDGVERMVAREALMEEYPQLKDAGNMARVEKVMKSMNGDIKGTKERMAMAAKIEFASEMMTDAKTTLRKAHMQRDDGVPEVPTGAPKSSGPHTPEEYRMAALDARMNGDLRLAKEHEARLQHGS